MDKMRWRYGDTNPVVAPVAADTIIEIGDPVWQDEEMDNARPASEACSSRRFRDRFLGIAMQRSRKGDSSPLRVATTGIHEFDCRPDVQFALGTLMAPCANELQLSNSAMIATATEFAIGRVDKSKPIGASTVLLRIKSTVMEGGV